MCYKYQSLFPPGNLEYSVAQLFFYVSMLNKPDTNDKKALLTIEKYITIVQVKD